MRVRMRDQISGTRNGDLWPPPGGEIDLPDNEAVKLCSNGLAAPVVDKDADVEKRDDEESAEKPAPKRRGRPPGSKNQPKTDEG